MHPDELSFTSGLDASGNMSSRQLYQVCVAQDELVDEVRSLDFFTQTLVDACFADQPMAFIQKKLCEMAEGLDSVRKKIQPESVSMVPVLAHAFLENLSRFESLAYKNIWKGKEKKFRATNSPDIRNLVRHFEDLSVLDNCRTGAMRALEFSAAANLRTDKFAVGEKIAGKRITAQLLFPRKDFSKNPAHRPEQNMLTVPVTFLRSKKDNALMQMPTSVDYALLVLQKGRDAAGIAKIVNETENTLREETGFPPKSRQYTAEHFESFTLAPVWCDKMGKGEAPLLPKIEGRKADRAIQDLAPIILGVKSFSQSVAQYRKKDGPRILEMDAEGDLTLGRIILEHAESCLCEESARHYSEEYSAPK